MDAERQLSQSIRKWNEETDLDRWENHYYEDNYNGNRLRSREKRVLEFLDSLNLPKKSKILELGYGAGVTSAKIYSRGFNLIGVDISAKLRELAVKNCEKFRNEAKFEFLVGNAEKLDFPDQSFDCVIGLGFLHYLASPRSCLSEVERVLKPGSYFIITQRNMYGLSSFDGPLKWLRSLYYLVSRRRYELRWRNQALIYYPILGLAAAASPFSSPMERLKQDLFQHKRIGLVRKNLMSFPRLKKMLEEAGLSIIKESGAGYLTKKSFFFPKAAKRLDQYLQSLSDRREKSFWHKIGNSVVFLAQKKEE